MEKLYDSMKRAIVTFKLESCCCFAPVRTGVLIAGYFNVFLSFFYLVGIAEGGIMSPLMGVQEVILEDEGSKIIGVLAHGTELGFNMCLLCAMYRKDIVLLRVYMYFGLAVIVASVLIYSMVIAAVMLLTKIYVISTVAYQCYVILLVRSVMVEIKDEVDEEKNGHITLYSVARLPEANKDIDVEMAPEIQPETVEPQPNENQNSEHKEVTKLETVKENPKEGMKVESVSENPKEK